MPAQVPSKNQKVSFELNLGPSGLDLYIRTSFGTIIPWETIANVIKQVQDIEHCPSHNNDIVDAFKENHSNSRVSNALENGTNLSDDRHAANAKILSNGHFQKEKWDSASEHGDEVGD